MARIHIDDIETAINHWRTRAPSPDGVALDPSLAALAEVYARLVFLGETQAEESALSPPARRAWEAWFETTPDTPCIAICSTSQGDAVCKGCGRSFDEIQQWTAMTAAAKRAVWRRIVQDGSAWRFNRYAERALERPSPVGGPPVSAE